MKVEICDSLHYFWSSHDADADADAASFVSAAISEWVQTSSPFLPSFLPSFLLPSQDPRGVATAGRVRIWREIYVVPRCRNPGTKSQSIQTEFH